jgi:hypothetical protein
MPNPPDAFWQDPFWNVRNDVECNGPDGLVVRHTEWFPGLLDAVAYLRNTGQYGHKDLPVLAHVPGVVVEQWCIDQRVTFDQFTRDPALKAQFLNDPANSLFRVKGGRA